MFTSYYVEAILVTIFLFAFSVWHLRQYVESQKDSRSSLLSGTQYHHELPTRASRLGFRAIGAFRGSLNEFLGASMLFSIAMLVAALYMSGKGTAQRRSPLADTEVPGDSVLYDMMLSMLAATFSIFPVTILYAMQRRDSDCSFKKREYQAWVCRAVLALIWMLGAAEVYASLYGNFDYDHRDHYDSVDYMLNCDWRGSVHYWDGSKSFLCPAGRLF